LVYIVIALLIVAVLVVARALALLGARLVAALAGRLFRLGFFGRLGPRRPRLFRDGVLRVVGPVTRGLFFAGDAGGAGVALAAVVRSLGHSVGRGRGLVLGVRDLGVGHRSVLAVLRWG
jgi:hypothetical protein